MKIHQTIISLVSYVLLGTTSLFAQPSTQPSYGIYGDGTYNLHQADFRALPGVPNCCERFSSGSGVGMSLGVIYQQPIINDHFFLGIRGGYNSLSAVLTRIEQTTVTGNVPGEFEHKLEATLSSVNIEPVIGYHLFKNFSLQVGVSAGYLLQKQFHQRETIITPGNGTFLHEQSRYRNDSSGDIPNAGSMALGLLGGVSYTLPLNASRTLLLAPEVMMSYGLTNFVEGLSWKGHAIRVGASILYSPAAASTTLPPKEEPVRPVEPPPVIVTNPVVTSPKPAIMATLSAVGIDEAGREVPNVTLRVEEFLSTQMKPLLPYIFFDEQSSQLDERYIRLRSSEHSTFSIDKLQQFNTLETYYNLLNIVGRRMTDHPQAKLTLIGCHDNTGERTVEGLSQKRAEAVRNYLVSIWKIPSSRLTIETRVLPEKPSNTNEPDGIEENRRVELYSDEWKILEPVTTNDTLRQANPPVLRIRPTATAEAGIAEWKVNIDQYSTTVKEFKGEASTIPSIINWEIAQDQDRSMQGSNNLQVTLQVRDNKAHIFQTQTIDIPLDFVSIQTKRRERIADKEVDRFSLILFDFDKSTLSQANQRITDIIKPYIRPLSSVSITGYTDRMGDAIYNAQLSKLRAQASSQALQAKNVQISGVGEENLLYDNSLPEGRFYSRTVNIVIETPVEK